MSVMLLPLRAHTHSHTHTHTHTHTHSFTHSRLMGVLNVPKHTGMPSPAVMWDRMGVCVCVCVCVWMDLIEALLSVALYTTLSRDLLMVALPALEGVGPPAALR